MHIRCQTAGSVGRPCRWRETLETHQEKELDGRADEFHGLLGGWNEALICDLEQSELFGELFTPFQDFVPAAAPGRHPPETLIRDENQQSLTRHALGQRRIFGAFEFSLELWTEREDGVRHNVVATGSNGSAVVALTRTGRAGGHSAAHSGRLARLNQGSLIKVVLLCGNGRARCSCRSGDIALLDHRARNLGLHDVPGDDGGSLSGSHDARDRARFSRNVAGRASGLVVFVASKVINEAHVNRLERIARCGMLEGMSAGGGRVARDTAGC